MRRGTGTTRELWERCDHALGTGLALTARYDRLAPPPGPPAAAALPCEPATRALAALTALGWPVSSHDGRPMLECGSHADALQVPRAAGILAAAWWRGTGGAADPARGLPALPSPTAALAVIDTGNSWYFLTAPGSYPFPALPPRPAIPGDGTSLIRWHGPGSRITLPPACDTQGRPAAWAFTPPEQPRLADPVTLLALLGPAAAMTRHAARCLILPGGIRVTPPA